MLPAVRYKLTKRAHMRMHRKGSPQICSGGFLLLTKFRFAE